MKRHRIFISSVQKELSHERTGLRDYIHADPLLRRFFDVFLFEDLPAADRKLDKVFFEKVRSSEIYLGLFGNEYGLEDEQGISSTEHEFIEATKHGKLRLIYVKGAKASGRLKTPAWDFNGRERLLPSLALVQQEPLPPGTMETAARLRTKTSIQRCRYSFVAPEMS